MQAVKSRRPSCRRRQVSGSTQPATHAAGVESGTCSNGRAGMCTKHI
jgi:hypothetical protein